MPEVIVPAYPGVTSALGLLFVDPLDDFSWSYVRRHDEIDLAEIGAPTTGWRSGSSAVSRGRASSARRWRWSAARPPLHRPAALGHRAAQARSASGPRRRSRPSTTSTCASTATRTPAPGRDLGAPRGRPRRAREARPRGARSAAEERGSRFRARARVHFEGAGGSPRASSTARARARRRVSGPASSRSSTARSSCRRGRPRASTRWATSSSRSTAGLAGRLRLEMRNRPDHVRGPPQRLHEHRRRDGADARARRALPRRQRGPRLQRGDLRPRRPHGRRGQG